jgi:hypothetical protein
MIPLHKRSSGIISTYVSSYTTSYNFRAKTLSSLSPMNFSRISTLSKNKERQCLSARQSTGVPQCIRMR